MIWKMLPEEQQLNEHLSDNRFFPIYFPTDGTSILEQLTDLEQCIVELTVGQSSWGDEIPKSWAWFSRFIASRRDTHKIMSIKELKQAKPTVKYMDKQIRCMLMFYHETGMILHFDEDKLREFFILDIQWFIDAFKHIITDVNHMNAVKTPMELKNLTETGELCDDLLDRIWRNTGLNRFAENKSVILSYMEKLGLLVQGEDLHFVPSMNKRDFPSQLLEILSGLNDDMKTSVLHFEFTMFPAFTYYRLIVACLSTLNWDPVLDNHKCFYKNVAIFKVDGHCIIIAVSQRYIQLQIYCEESTLDKRTILQLREQLERTIQTLAGTFHDSLEYRTGYSCTPAGFGIDLNNTFITEGQMKKLKGRKCPLHSFLTGHSVEPVKFLQWWNMEIEVQRTFQAKDLEKQTDQDQSKEQHSIFSDNGIAYIAGRIGREWDLLLLHLGLQQAKIDQIQIDYGDRVIMRIIKGICIWRDRRAEINPDAIKDFFVALESCDRLDLVHELRKKYNLSDAMQSLSTPRTLINVNEIYRRIAIVKTQDIKGTGFRVGSKYLMSTYQVFREQLEMLWSLVYDILSEEERKKFQLHGKIPPDGPWNLTKVFNRDDVSDDAKQQVHQLGRLIVAELYDVEFGHTYENKRNTGKNTVSFNIPFVSREHDFVVLELQGDIPEGIPLYCDQNETKSLANIIGHPRGQLEMQDCQGILYTNAEALAKIKQEAIEYFRYWCRYDEETLISDYNTCHLQSDQLVLHCKQIMNPGSPLVEIDEDNTLRVKGMITAFHPKSVYDADDPSVAVTQEHSKYIVASGIHMRLVHEVLSKNEKKLCADLFGDNSTPP